VPTTDLTAVELRLRAILDPYRKHLVEDTVSGSKMLRRKGAKKRDWFAGIKRLEGAVEFGLAPLREHPDLLDDVPEGLQRRKTGPSAFGFTEIDENLARALETLVGRGFLAYMGEQ
jgi:hypothetical protein